MRLLVVAVAAALLVGACGGEGGTPSPGATATRPPGSATVTAGPSNTPPTSTATPTPAAVASPTVMPTGVPPTRVPGPARVVYAGPGTRREMALTFDAGADAGYASQILQVLRERGVRASFGMTGMWAEQNRDLLLTIAADGHRFINHSYSHASFTGASTGAAPLTAEERALELSRTEVTVYRYTSRSTLPYFRPPFGDWDESVLQDAGANGYGTLVMWSIDSLGWNGASAEAIVSRVLERAAPGAIVIMHVGSQSQDGPALQRVIDGLRADGYSLVTVDELLAP